MRFDAPSKAPMIFCQKMRFDAPSKAPMIFCQNWQEDPEKLPEPQSLPTNPA
jgi:hypothetical protein